MEAPGEQTSGLATASGKDAHARGSARLDRKRSKKTSDNCHSQVPMRPRPLTTTARDERSRRITRPVETGEPSLVAVTSPHVAPDAFPRHQTIVETAIVYRVPTDTPARVGRQALTDRQSLDAR